MAHAMPIVTVSGGSKTAADGTSVYDSFCAIKIDADGNVYLGSSIDGAAVSYTQVSTVTDWIRPASAASALYEVRVTSVDHDAGAATGSGWSTSPGADGSWFTLDIDREWVINETVVGIYQTTFTIEIRLGTTLDTGAYDLNIENTA